MRLDAAAETVGKRGKMAVFLFHRQKAHVVTAGRLARLGELRALHLDEKRAIHSDNPRCRIP